MVTIHVPDPRLGFGSVNFAECVSKGAVDSFAYMERGDCLCILLIRGVCYYIITPSSLKKRENSVGSVGKSVVVCAYIARVDRRFDAPGWKVQNIIAKRHGLFRL